MKFIPIDQHPYYYKEIEQRLKCLTMNQKPEKILQILFDFQKLIQSKDFGYYQSKVADKGKSLSNNSIFNNKHHVFQNNSRIPKYQNYNLAQFKVPKQTSRYKVLQDLYYNKMSNIFGWLAQIILKAKNAVEIVILEQDKSLSVDLNKQQVLYLMALMAMNLVPPQNRQLSSKLNRQNNFSHIFQEQEYKTKTIIQYFIYSMHEKDIMSQKFSIIRKYNPDSLEKLIYQEGTTYMRDCYIEDDNQSIDVRKFNGYGKVDFANKQIGGGALTRGCVQEEIMFANHPQMYISILLCESMKDSQALLFIGFKKYFKNSGYSSSTKYAGQEAFDYQHLNGRALQYIIAIDATKFLHNDQDQFNKHMIDRQIKKAYIGFNMLQNTNHIVTGNWGCGAFKGDIQLKFVIQWIAASLAKKQLIYCPFGQSRQITLLDLKMYENVKQMKVKEVYLLLMQAVKKFRPKNNNILELMFFNAKSTNFQKKTVQYHSDKVISDKNYHGNMRMNQQINVPQKNYHHQFRSIDRFKTRFDQKPNNPINQRIRSSYKKNNDYELNVYKENFFNKQYKKTQLWW